MALAFIIDDDPSIVDATQMQIPWDELQISDVKKIYTSEGLVMRILSEKPDVVFIDIELDEQSGLDILEQCRKHDLDTIFVIISGHDDFHYAQSAVNFGAFYYLLKPFSASDIANLVKKLKNVLNTKNNNISNYLVSHKEFEVFLSTKLKDEIMYRFLICSLDEAFLPQVEFLLSDALVRKYKINADKFLLILLNEKTTNDMLKALDEFARGNGVVIGISDAFDKSRHFFEHYREANSLSYQYFITGKGGLIRPGKKGIAALQKTLNDLDDAIKMQSAEKVDDLFKKLPRLFTNNNYTMFHVLLIYHTLVNKIETVFKQSIFPQYQLREEDMKMYFGSFSNLCNEFSEGFLTLFTTPAPSSSPASQSTWSSFEAYIEKNYHRRITAPVIAKELLISTTTFYNIIKQKTGSTFIEYLTSYRIKKAQELLIKTTLSIADIAEAVGIKDIFYFSKVFKKETGVNATEYRKAHNVTD